MFRIYWEIDPKEMRTREDFNSLEEYNDFIRPPHVFIVHITKVEINASR